MNPHLLEISTFFTTEYPLNKEGLNELLSLFKLQLFEKGNQLMSANEKEKQLRFLNKGIVRAYYATLEKETNIDFFTKPEFPLIEEY